MPTKLIRDTLNINDIEGARPKKDLWHIKYRNMDPYTFIEGSKPK